MPKSQYDLAAVPELFEAARATAEWRRECTVTPTGVILTGAMLDEYQSGIAFDYGLGVFDSTEKLIVESFGRGHWVGRITLDKTTEVTTCEDKRMRGVRWEEKLVPSADAIERICHKLEDLRYGVKSLDHITRYRIFETPELNEGRPVERLSLPPRRQIRGLQSRSRTL